MKNHYLGTSSLPVYIKTGNKNFIEDKQWFKKFIIIIVVSVTVNPPACASSITEIIVLIVKYNYSYP